MRTMIRWTSLLVASSLTLIGCASDRVQGSGDKSMSFFVTSASPGNGSEEPEIEGHAK